MNRKALNLAHDVRDAKIPAHEVYTPARPRRLPVAEFSRQEGYTPAQVRWWLFNRESNGLQAAGACCRIGRRIYIDLAGFERWIAAQNQQAAA